MLLSNRYNDFLTPGAIVEADPLEADRLGLFHEGALTAADVWHSNQDLSEPGLSEEYVAKVASAVTHQLKGGTAPWMRPAADGNLPYTPSRKRHTAA